MALRLAARYAPKGAKERTYLAQEGGCASLVTLRWETESGRIVLDLATQPLCEGIEPLPLTAKVVSRPLS